MSFKDPRGSPSLPLKKRKPDIDAMVDQVDCAVTVLRKFDDANRSLSGFPGIEFTDDQTGKLVNARDQLNAILGE